MPPALRRVNRGGSISLACQRYPVARWLAGETVEIVCGDHLVKIFHHGVLVVSHVARHQSDTNIGGRKRLNPRPRKLWLRPGIPSPAVTCLVEASGVISYAGQAYRFGPKHARKSVQVGVVDDHVEITLDGQVIRTHPILHDRSKEHGALANPTGRPRKPKVVA